jgi:hypothetical protein
MMNSLLIKVLMFLMLACSLLTCNNKLYINENKEVSGDLLVYFSVIKNNRYPLHGSVLLKSEKELLEIKEIHPLDSFICALYRRGIKFYDGSSVNYSKFDSINLIKIQSSNYVQNLEKTYRHLKEERIVFNQNQAEVILRTVNATVDFYSSPKSKKCSENWLSYEYQIPCKCLVSDSIYMVSSIILAS